MNSIYNIYQHHFTNQINFFPPQKSAIFAQIQSLYPNAIIFQEGMPTKELVNEITHHICDLATHWLKLTNNVIINLHINKLQNMQMSLVSFEEQYNDLLKLKNDSPNYHIDNMNIKSATKNDKIRKINFKRKSTKNSNSSFNTDFNSNINVSKSNISKGSIKLDSEDPVIVIDEDLNHTIVLDSIQVDNAIDLTIDNESIKKNYIETNNNIETNTLIPIKVETVNDSTSKFNPDFVDEEYTMKNNIFQSTEDEEHMQLQLDYSLGENCQVNYKKNCKNLDNLNIIHSKGDPPELQDYSLNREKNVTDCDPEFSNQLFTENVIKCKLDSYNHMEIIESKEVELCIAGDNDIIVNTKQASILHINSNNEHEISLILKMLNNDDTGSYRYPDIFPLKQDENKSINFFNDTLDSLINEELAHKDVLSYKKKLYNCFRCRYSTDILINYQRHLKAHNGRFICRLCNRAFVKSDDLYRHWSTHNVKANNGQYMCDSCDFTAPSKVSVEEHMRSHYRLKMAKAQSEKVCCGICKCLIDRSKQYEHKRIVHGRFFRKEASFESLKSKHLSNCLSGKLYKCPECCRHIRNARALLRHHFVAHIQPKSPEKGQKIWTDDTSQMKCRFCKLDFVEVEELDKHEVGHVISEFVVTDVTSSLKHEMIDLDGMPAF